MRWGAAERAHAFERRRREGGIADALGECSRGPPPTPPPRQCKRAACVMLVLVGVVVVVSLWTRQGGDSFVEGKHLLLNSNAGSGWLVCAWSNEAWPHRKPHDTFDELASCTYFVDEIMRSLYCRFEHWLAPIGMG